MRDRHATKRPLGGAKAAAALLALAALGQPLVARVLAEMNHTAAYVLPTVIVVVTLCLLTRYHFMSELAVIVTYAVEALLVVARGRWFSDSPLRAILDGNLFALGVPIGAILLGHATAWVERHRPLWQWGGKTNLGLLLRRPAVLARAYRWPIVIVLVGTVLDTVTTMRVMYVSGASAEMHPAMRAFALELGVTWGVPLASMLRLAFVFFVASFWRVWCGALLVIVGAGYTLAAASNHFGWL